MSSSSSFFTNFLSSSLHFLFNIVVQTILARDSCCSGLFCFSPNEAWFIIWNAGCRGVGAATVFFHHFFSSSLFVIFLFRHPSFRHLSSRHPSLRHSLYVVVLYVVVSLRHLSLFHLSVRRLSLNVVFRNGSDDTGQTCRPDQNHSVDLLQQMTFSRQTVPSLEDYIKMREAMTAKMEKGFRNEQQARQQAQKENMDGINIEENAQMVQIGLQATKVKIRQFESGSGSGSIVDRGQYCRWKRAKRYFRKTNSGSGRSALNDFFMPRRLEFKGWITDYKQCRYQGLTDT